MYPKVVLLICLCIHHSKSMYNERWIPDVNCGRRASQLKTRIIEGKESTLGEFPWMALIIYSKGEYRCSAFLITKRFALTAAHCVIYPDKLFQEIGEPTHLKVGDHDIRTEIDCVGGNCAPPAFNVLIETFQVHPDYVVDNVNYVNDIGLIKLSNEIITTDYVNTICLPSITLPIGTYLTVAGWGSTQPGIRDNFSNFLLNTILPLRSNSECADALRASQLCAGWGEADHAACFGVSGTPLMYHNLYTGLWAAYGIVSYGPMTCRGVPSVFTNIEYFLNWIENTMKWMG